MKRYLTLALCLFWASSLWADSQPTPPVIPLPEGDNTLPPPPGQWTPVSVPSLPGTENAAAPPALSPSNGGAQAQETTVPPPPVGATPTPVPTAVPPTETPAPEIQEATPTPQPAAPTPALGAAQEAPPPAEEPASTQTSAGSTLPASSGQAGSPQAGTLSDYFPITPGAQWTYEYLKPGPGETAQGTFTVQCEGAKSMANGTVRAVFETTEGGQKTRSRYSLYGDRVEHTASGAETFTGDYVFKLPPTPSGAAYWTVSEANGTAHKSKAVFDQAQVYQKTYPDCVVVTEKLIQGGKPSNTVIYYYAKGIGLVSMEVYSPSMKLIQPKSFALMSGPGSNN